MSECRIISFSLNEDVIDLSINDVFYLYFNIEKLLRFRRKRDLSRDVNERKYHFDNVSSINEKKLLNDRFFEIINKKSDQ